MWFDFSNSLAEIEGLKKEIDSIFNRMGHTRGNVTFPLVNFYDSTDEITLVAELPGLTKEDINITLTDNLLMLSGKREEKRYGEKVQALREERIKGNFEKTLRIPVMVEREKINASFSDGLLTVKLPKAEEVKPKKISIQA